RDRIAKSFLTVSDENIYADVLDVVLDVFQSEHGFFGYLDEQENLVCPSLTRNVWKQCQMKDKDVVFLRESWGGLWGQSLMEKRALYSNGPLRVPEGHVALRNVLVAPILHKGRLIGQFAVANKHSHFDERDKGLLEAIADYVAPVLHARLEQDRSARQRSRAEQTLQLSHRFLQITNRHSEMAPLLKEFVAEVKRFTGSAAVGIRILDDHGGIPYQAYEGFCREFHESENPLSIQTDQCMCINVIKGAVDPSFPCYSQGGSFYAGSMTRLVESISEDQKGPTRNACNKFGYESVALIPIRMGDDILGLIHVADPRENAAPLETVELLEKAAMQLGVAIRRVRAEQELRTARDELEIRVEDRTQELAEANRALEAEMAERKRLEEEVLRVGTQEQQRIGQELHDGLGQQLLGLGMMAKSLQKTLQAKTLPEADYAQQITEAMVEAQNHVRAILKGVYPVDVDANGLMAALADLAGSTETLADVSCTFACSQPVPIDDNHTATQLFHVASEAVRNAVKHAGASEIVIGLDAVDGQLALWVRDDGVGIRCRPDQSSGMGLRIMRHRAGIIGATLEIEPAEGGGTLVTCTIRQDRES
ncbi:MAG: GAF domain-containing protein, partial [Planctomycetota bacterium]